MPGVGLGYASRCASRRKFSNFILQPKPRCRILVPVSLRRFSIPSSMTCTTSQRRSKRVLSSPNHGSHALEGISSTKSSSDPPMKSTRGRGLFRIPPHRQRITPVRYPFVARIPLPVRMRKRAAGSSILAMSFDWNCGATGQSGKNQSRRSLLFPSTDSRKWSSLFA